MRYSLGESLADFGFSFLEKLHEPIFLVNRMGKLIKVNEAGRKLLRVVSTSPLEIQNFVKSSVLDLFQGLEECYHRIPVGKKGHHLIARSFLNSDLLLIELIR